MKRRTFLTRISTLAATSLVNAGALNGTSQKGPSSLRIAVLNDLHHDSPACDPWFAQVAGVVKSETPDLCVLAGDLANTGLKASLVSVRDHFSVLDCPVCPIPGNHDCDVTDDTSLYQEVFPGKLNYLVRKPGWQLIFLDTTQGKDWKDTVVSDSTLSWLDNAVSSLDREVPSLVFSHFPLANGIHMAPLNTEEVWKRLNRMNVRAVFCGHFHGQHQVVLPPLVTTNICCAREGVRGNFDGDPRRGFWIVQADAGTGTLDLKCRLVTA